MAEHADTLASISRSMWGTVTPDLRAVAFGLTDKQLAVRFIYERPPSAEQQAMVSAAETECIADFWQSHDVSYVAQSVEVAKPLTLSDCEHWVYLRYEAN